MIWSFIKQNHEVIVALSSIVVSVCALLVSFFGLRNQRRFNFLSVRPAIKIDVSDYLNKWEVALANKGLGPLTVTGFTVVSSDGEEKRNLVEFMPQLPKEVPWDTVYWNVKGEIIEAGESIVLLRFSPDRIGNLTKLLKEIRTQLGKLTIQIEAVDFYDRPLPKYEYELDIFKKGFVSED